MSLVVGLAKFPLQDGPPASSSDFFACAEIETGGLFVDFFLARFRDQNED